jgi:glycine cleavage system aminomethyltransferase T
VGVEIAAAPPRPRPWLPAARLTSECDSPVFRRRLGLGFVDAADSRPGSLVALEDGRMARVARLPFYDPARRLPRAQPL